MIRSKLRLTAALVFGITLILMGLLSPAAQAAVVAITLTPNNGAPGSMVTITSGFFAANETPIQITYDGVLQATTAADPAGNLNTIIVIPASPSGSHVIAATGPTNNGSAIFIVTPAISITKTGGPVGTSITVNGSGFAASEAGIAVTYGGTAQVSSIVADLKGKWSATFSIPASVSGPHIINASGLVTPALSPGLTFSVTPSIAASKLSGPSGTSLSITGSGFATNEQSIVVTYDSNSVVSGISANPQGSWSTPMTVPQSVSGSHLIGAYGASTVASSVPTLSFTVGPAISLNKTSGPTGTSITVSGSGFTAGETDIVVTYDGNTVNTVKAASSQGNWSSTFTVPPSASGPHPIAASGVASTATAVAFNVTPAISSDKTNGPSGTSVTITGTGFAANEQSLTVTYDGSSVVTSVTVDPQGGWVATVVVPRSTSGSHKIGAHGAVTGAAAVPGVTFTVSVSITASRTSGTPGTSVTISGSGFAAREQGITVTYDGTTLASNIQADAQGSWSQVITVPQSAAGPHTVDATSAITAASSVPDVTFAITPALSIGKTGGPTGTVVTVSGVGFGANETGIVMTFDGTAVSPGVAANAQGSWSSSLTVPASTSGQHTISASGSQTAATTVNGQTFSVTPTISVSKTSGASGTAITITGTGFAASESGITVSYDDATLVTGISANAQGTWSTTATVPPSAAGSHSIRVSGSTTQLSGVNEVGFTSTPHASLSTDIGYVGQTIQLSGAGFAAISAITFTYDDNQLAVDKTATDAAGSFSKAITIPRSPAGPHTVKVTDAQNNSFSATFTVSNTPPSAPSLLSPNDGSRVGAFGSTTPTFRWSNVTDPSGVTFTLQIDVSPDFSQPVLEVMDIAGTRYTLTQTQALTRGSYYWRVRAFNGASVQGAWSQVRVLKSGISAAFLTGFILLAVAAIAAGLYFGLLRRRLRKPAPVAAAEAGIPQVVTGQWRTIEPTEASGGERPLPWRLALPQPEKGPDAISPEDDARIKVIIDFAQSLPLFEPRYDVTCLVELLENGMGIKASDAVYGQLLKGEVQLRYDPAWLRHPIYQDLATLLEGEAVLQNLNAYIEAVKGFASEAVELLQDIYQDVTPEISQEVLEKGVWTYVAAVYTDAMYWFMGKSLRDPSERDYVIKPVNGPQGEARWLCGEDNTSFAGQLVQAPNEKEAQRLRDLHIGLRRNSRTNDWARRVSVMITQLEIQRRRLLNVFEQLGQMKR